MKAIKSIYKVTTNQVRKYTRPRLLKAFTTNEAVRQGTV